MVKGLGSLAESRDAEPCAQPGGLRGPKAPDSTWEVLSSSAIRVLLNQAEKSPHMSSSLMSGPLLQLPVAGRFVT